MAWSNHLDIQMNTYKIRYIKKWYIKKCMYSNIMSLYIYIYIYIRLLYIQQYPELIASYSYGVRQNNRVPRTPGALSSLSPWRCCLFILGCSILQMFSLTNPNQIRYILVGYPSISFIILLHSFFVGWISIPWL